MTKHPRPQGRIPRSPSLSPLIPSGLAALFALAACSGNGASEGLFGERFFQPEQEEEEEPGTGGLINAFELSYPADFLFTEVGEALQPQVPLASTQVLSYSIDPALPAGLVLDPASGVLSGTPLERAAVRSYRVRATNQVGTAEFELTLTVAGKARYALVANEGDDTLSIYALGAEPGALQATGYVPLSPLEVGPERLRSHPGGEFVFSLNLDSSTLSSLRVDLQQGTLVGAQAISIGAGAHDLAVHPDGERLYVSSTLSDSLRVYQFDPQTGALAQTGATLAVHAAPQSVQIAPNGRYLVLTHADGTLESYLLDANTGQPTLVSGLVIAQGSALTRPAIAPRSNRLYSTLPDFATAVHVLVAPETGVLSYTGGMASTEIAPSELHLAPNGARAYVFNADSTVTLSPSVSIYPVNAANGALGEPEHQQLEFAPQGISFAANGHSVVLVDESLPGPRRFELLADDGRLSEGGAARARVAPGAVLVLDGDAELERRVLAVFVANGEMGDITPLAAAADGTLSPAGPPVPGGGSAVDLAIDPLRRYLWLANDTPGLKSLITYELLGGGQLAQRNELILLGRPTAIAVEPSGRYLYLATDDAMNLVRVLRIAADGSLTILASEPVGNSPTAVEVDPTGRFLYVVNSGAEATGDQGSISAFRIDVDTGAMTPLPMPAFAGGRPLNLAFSHDAARAYSAFSNADLAAPYSIDAATGALAIPTVASQTADQPTDLALSPDGRFAWIANRGPSGGGGVELFDVRAEDGALYDAQTGLLEARELFDTGLEPMALEVDPSGSFLYVLHQESERVTTFAIDSGDGGLALLDTDVTGSRPVALELFVGVP